MFRKFLSALLTLVLSFGIATSAMAAEKQADKAQKQFIQEVAKLQRYMKIDDNGFFQLTAKSAKEGGVSQQTFAGVKTQLAEVNGEMSKLTKQERIDMFKSGKAPNGVHADSCLSVYIPKWALRAYAWWVIIVGGATAVIGGFLDATIVGLPAGAVLNAVGVGLGITGSALLWWVDNYYQSRTYRVCW